MRVSENDDIDFMLILPSSNTFKNYLKRLLNVESGITTINDISTVTVSEETIHFYVGDTKFHALSISIPIKPSGFRWEKTISGVFVKNINLQILHTCLMGYKRGNNDNIEVSFLKTKKGVFCVQYKTTISGDIHEDGSFNIDYEYNRYDLGDLSDNDNNNVVSCPIRTPKDVGHQMVIPLTALCLNELFIVAGVNGTYIEFSCEPLNTEKSLWVITVGNDNGMCYRKEIICSTTDKTFKKLNAHNDKISCRFLPNLLGRSQRMFMNMSSVVVTLGTSSNTMENFLLFSCVNNVKKTNVLKSAHIILDVSKHMDEISSYL